MIVEEDEIVVKRYIRVWKKVISVNKGDECDK